MGDAAKGHGGRELEGRRNGKLTPRQELQHELALHLGMTVEHLARNMGEAEFRNWQRYAGKRMLPWRRMELYLAQMAMVTATSAGAAQDVTISDFLFDTPEEPSAQDEADFFDFKPRNIKQG